ncbi:carbohydrate deacetylase [Enterococcus gilvus]|uniref:carbohydrate deacetylase n=1 Tax=Enterococcus gilvus TaxID=160453 RepID=UPI00290F9FFF|nr:carbohydrate deacetylase [Enterococcus gilvus]MDU5510859.1 carbohydrate deacetylase [Enterococcus gilvus]
MKQLIINADDFGYSAAINAGIIHSHLEGVLTSTTLMANMPGTMEAIELSKQYPRLGVGCHLVLTMGRPLDPTNRSFQDENGRFYKLCDYPKMRASYSEEEIFHEWCTQIDFLLSKGVKLTHFDSHHHIHFYPENHKITKRISEKYGLPFRNSFGTEHFEYADLAHTNELLLDMMNTKAIRDMSQGYNVLRENCLLELTETFARAKEAQVLEMMVHPAFVDEYLFTHSSFNIARMREVEILTDPAVRQLIDSLNYELVTYQTIKPNQNVFA